MSLKSFDLGVPNPPFFTEEEKALFERFAKELRELAQKYPPVLITSYRTLSQAQRDQMKGYPPVDFFFIPGKEEREKEQLVLTVAKGRKTSVDDHFVVVPFNQTKLSEDMKR